MCSKNSKVLYQLNASPPARAVRMVIDILGLDVELKDVNPILRDQDTPEMVQKNAMKTIPLYEEGDYNLADSHAIMIYLMEKYGKPEHSQWYPSDIRKRATIQQRLFFDCGILFLSLRNIMGPIYMGKLGELTRGMIQAVERGYAVLEVYLSQTLYVADNVMTIADLSIMSTMASLDGLIPVDEKRFPKLRQWLLRMDEVEVCRRINKPGSIDHVEILKLIMKNTKQRQSKNKL